MEHWRTTHSWGRSSVPLGDQTENPVCVFKVRSKGGAGGSVPGQCPPAWEAGGRRDRERG